MTGGTVMRYATEARRRVIFSIAAAVWMCPVASWAQTVSTGSGQGFPGKPVRYVVTFAAGAAPDIVGRLLSDRLTRMWGQQVIVDNRVGVGGVMGTAFVAKAAPDGYTLVQCNVGTSAIAMSLYATLPYDQVRDFAPVTRIGTTPYIVVVHPSVPFQSMKELIAYP
jgi:tripartite-type tricarboxylate transporter receptor subunit TctC